MSDPVVDAQLQTRAERLRALEDEAFSQRRIPVEDGFDGVREYSRAGHENRTPPHLLSKSSADPGNRYLVVAVIFGIIAVWTYLLTQ